MTKMTTMNNLLQWHKLIKQPRPKTSFKNLAKWFQKTLLEEVFKMEFSRDNYTIKIHQDWSIFISLRTRLFRKNFTRFSTAKINTLRNHQLTVLILNSLSRITMLTLVVPSHLTKFQERDIASLDNTKALKMPELLKRMFIIQMNRYN